MREAVAGKKRVSVWTDGSAAQFKNNRTIAFITLDWLPRAVGVVYHFRASGHGKGPADTRAATIKTTLRRHVLTRDVTVTSNDDLVEFIATVPGAHAAIVSGAADADDDVRFPIARLRSMHCFQRAPRAVADVLAMRVRVGARARRCKCV